MGDAALPNTGTYNNVLQIENAKTSRSRCRKCMEKIEKGELRVGMKAWIMGRSAMTWNHPKCFAENIKLDEAANSRTKCKVSNIPFQAGDVRIGLRSHTATSWVSVGVLEKLLSPISEHLPTSSSSIGALEGFSTKLSDVHQREVVALFQRIQTSSVKAEKIHINSKNVVVAKKETEKKVEQAGAKKKEQPKIGKRTLTKGNVAWKFGAHICFGVLIASRETKTHCYAKTHKGNIKTLAKGKDYWWLR